MPNNIIPDGFDFYFHPFCSGCPDYEPETEKYMCNSETYLTIIKCENYKKCGRISTFIESGFKEEIKNEKMVVEDIY